MKRNPNIITFIYFLIITLIINTSICTADVWLSPMKIHASGTVNQNESILIEKTIYLKNDANKSAIVTFNVLNNSVIFENNTEVLGPLEEKYIHPMIIVRQGNHTDSVYVTSSPFNTSKLANQTGSLVTTSMLIRITSQGIISNDVTNNNETIVRTENSNIYLFLILCIIIIGFIISGTFIRKKFKNNKQ